MSYLSKEALEVQRAYKKQWRAKNKEKVKESNRRYWEKKALSLKVGEEHEQ